MTDPGLLRTRRPPPPFRLVTLTGREWLSPRLVRITLAGPGLEGFAVGEPAASVRLLVPSPGTQRLVIPEWNGNEFLLPDGLRPALRTFTPRRLGADPPTLDIDVVVHRAGVAAQWAVTAQPAGGAHPGDPAAISGPGRGYHLEGAPGAQRPPGYLLAGDETAIPAISQLLETIPPDVAVQVIIEATGPEAHVALPEHPRATLHWHDLAAGAAPGDALVAAVTDTRIAPGTRVWVAGEAASVQRIRRHLFEQRQYPRSLASIQGYWKFARAAAG